METMLVEKSAVLAMCNMKLLRCGINRELDSNLFGLCKRGSWEWEIGLRMLIFMVGRYWYRASLAMNDSDPLSLYVINGEQNF